MFGNGNFALYDSARRTASAKGRGGASRKHPASDIAVLPIVAKPRADDSGRSARGSLGRFRTVRRRGVHLVAHSFHLTKNAKSVGAENLFEVRRAIAALE